MSRILLLLDHKQNRELLAQYLAAHYQVLPEEHQLLEPFDLCVVDPPALERLHEQVRARKASEQPVFLPVLLVASHHAVSVATHHLWEIVDESIAAPIHKTELQARVEILLHARQLSRENASLLGQLETELARAGEVQTQLLPRELPALEDFDLAARCLPARQVGGDFYDWEVPRPGILSLTLGDSMGKGMPAALLTATIRAALRTAACKNPPAMALELVRSALQEDFLRSSSFVTLFHSQLELSTRRLSFVDAGHGHAFVRRANGTVEKLLPRGPALGIPIRKPYQEGILTFQGGDTLVVYSDGLVETASNFVLDHETLAEKLGPPRSADAMLDRLLSLAEVGAEQIDDIALLVLHCRAAVVPAREQLRRKAGPEQTTFEVVEQLAPAR
ncbi:MAG TPA: SpoIIE family protein phosphatase [Verrucomicrobiae bacterium]|nr:SpoIIE family protein phosphatase [Verrucomicrobiae bacterium]